jgi:cell wall-associated NlpC family hydrolase
MRSGAGRQFPVVGALAEGTIVTVLDGPQTSADGTTWLKIQGGGATGWSSAEWLAEKGTAPAAPAAPVASTAPAAPTDPWAAPATTASAPPAAPATPDTGSTITNGGAAPRVTGTGGRGARLRAQPSTASAVLLVIPEGAEVELTGAGRTAEGYEWMPVRYTGVLGWVASSLLGAAVAKPSSTPAAAPPVAPTAAPTPAPVVAPTPVPAAPAPPAAPVAAPLAPGDYAQIVDTDGYNLRIRARPGLDTPVVSSAPANAVVLITAGPQVDATGAPWYGIDFAGVKGWALGEHLARTTAPVGTVAPSTTAAPSVAPTPAPSARASAQPTASPAAAPVAAAPAGNRGQAIVTTAQRYLGVPYVYGGTTPAGWDCSGFVGYVYKEAAGISLPRSAAQQYRVGTKIPIGQEQAGDIVFFSDTFGPGITHDGIALGDGRFIHARSEGYGTVISSLTDAYWSQHYVGAQRP